MNLLFICDEYPPGKIGGIGTAVQTLARELVKQGHKVTVAGLYPYHYGQKDYEDDRGVKVWRLRYGLKLPVSHDSRLYNIADKFPAVVRRTLYTKKAFSRFIDFLKKVIRDEQTDIIELPDFTNFAQHAGFVLNWPAFSIPLLVKSHGSYTYFCEEVGIPVIKQLHDTDVELYKRADALCAVSNYTAEKNKMLFGVNQEIRVLYNGVEIPEQVNREPRDPKTVAFTGSLAPKKGILSLIKAWNKVHDRFPEAKLLIMGKGKTHHLIPLLSEEAQTTVEFNGHVDRSVLFKQLSKATLSIFPSYSETFGLGVVEAMTLCCPVIYTKRSCGPEIVRDGIDGLLVDPDNIKEIADSIISMIEHADMRARLAASGLESVKKRFEITHITYLHLQFYAEVITKFNAHAVSVH